MKALFQSVEPAEVASLRDLIRRMEDRNSNTPFGQSPLTMKPSLSRQAVLNELLCLSMKTRDPLLKGLCKGIINVFGS